MTKKRFGCLRILLICALLLIGLIVFWGIVNFPSPPKAGKPLVRVSPETTVITEPLDENGDPDYVEYLNRTQGAGVTPENNAAVLLMRVMGPTPEGNPFSNEYYERLGIKPLPVTENYWFDFPVWKQGMSTGSGQLSALQRHEVLCAQYDFAIKNPWTAAQLPDLAEWLEQNSKRLDMIRQATMRPRYYAPLIADSQIPTVIGIDLELSDTQRNFARMLSISAMNNLAKDRVDHAFADTLAIRRSARLVNQAPSLIEYLMAIKIEETGIDAELRIAHSGKATRRQLLDYLAITRQLSPLDGISDRIDNYERFLTVDAVIKMGRNPSLRSAFLEKDESSLFDSIVYSAADWESALQVVHLYFDRLVAATRKESLEQIQNELINIENEFEKINTESDYLSSCARVVAGGRRAKGVYVGKIIALKLVPVITEAVKSVKKAKAKHLLSLTVFSLETYKIDRGEYPQLLDQLVPEYCDALPRDPLINEPFRYQRIEDKYQLNSVEKSMSGDVSANVTFENWNEIQRKIRRRWSTEDVGNTTRNDFQESSTK